MFKRHAYIGSAPANVQLMYVHVSRNKSKAYEDFFLNNPESLATLILTAATTHGK